MSNSYVQDAKAELRRVASETLNVVTSGDSFARVAQSAGGARTVAIATLVRVAHQHGLRELDLDVLLRGMPEEKRSFALFRIIGEAHGAHRSLTLPGGEG